MSAPNNQAIDSENLKYGFLAARAEEALNKKLENQELSGDDIRILSEAHLFLNTLAEGAELVETGVYRGHNSRESMRALRMAMDPLKQLSEAQQQPEIADYFQKLTRALDPKVLATSNYDPELLRAAERFFQLLYGFLTTAISRNRRKSTTSLNERKPTGS